MPGSETGELLISGGLALPAARHEGAQKRADAGPGGGLTDTLSSLANLLALQHFGNKANETLKHHALQDLPGQVK